MGDRNEIPKLEPERGNELIVSRPFANCKASDSAFSLFDAGNLRDSRFELVFQHPTLL
jgi:hypothetical protein